jgi:SAM-dependent methyltransferase
MSTDTLLANTPGAWDERAAEPTSWQAAMWSRKGQEARFKAVRSALRLDPGDSLLDYGCGTGRLRRWLDPVEYYGYDWSPAMRERARLDQAEWPGTILDELPPGRFDHVVCVGTFNLADGWSKDETGMTLLDLWMKHVGKSLVVCLYRGEDPACLRYLPVEAAMWAQRLCKRWAIDASYLENDFMLVMRR